MLFTDQGISEKCIKHITQQVQVKAMNDKYSTLLLRLFN